MDRLALFRTIVLACAVIIVARLLYWQFVSPQKASFAKDLDDSLPAQRGEINASDGFPLVTNQEAFLLYGKPHEITNSAKVAQSLAPYLILEKYATFSAIPMDLEEQRQKEIEAKETSLEARLSNKILFWVQLARKVAGNIKERIEQENIKGIGWEKDDKRFYPEASMAAQVLGFVASDKLGQDTGYFGLEGFYDRILKGKLGQAGAQLDPRGLPILVGRYRRIEPQTGSTLILSLDRAIQFMVEEKIKKAVEKYEARQGTVIIATPDSRILSMATYPSYDPVLLSEYDQNLYKNPAVADTYEPGSTFKLITMAAALDLAKVTHETRCEICTGPRRIADYEISTWNKKYYPNSTMTDVIVHSDNIGMTYVADKLGVDNFFDYIGRFGFGKKTDIDLQEEVAGYVRPKKDWSQIDLATASFGQGIAVTPVQMIQAVAAIASGGQLTTPRVAQKIVDGKIERETDQSTKRIISQKAALELTEMMVAAVKEGEARAFAPKGYRIAGKTGTAQIPVAGHYDPEKTIASFVGFAPADNPKFVMLVRFTEPTSSPFGSETAAPTFFEIAQELFNYWSIPPK